MASTASNGFARWVWTLLLGAAAAGLACEGDEAPQACTLIACSSGLQVDLDVTPAGGFRVEAEVPGTPGRYVVECEEGAACARVFFSDFTPGRVRISVVTEDGASRWLAEPVYAEHRPNGPGCPPTCRVGRVRVPGTQTRSGP